MKLEPLIGKRINLQHVETANGGTGYEFYKSEHGGLFECNEVGYATAFYIHYRNDVLKLIQDAKLKSKTGEISREALLQWKEFYKKEIGRTFKSDYFENHYGHIRLGNYKKFSKKLWEHTLSLRVVDMYNNWLFRYCFRDVMK